VSNSRIDPTTVSFTPVDENGDEIELGEDEYLRHGDVLHVPAVGDAVFLNNELWSVVRRVWAVPVAYEQAQSPRQWVTLHVQREGSSAGGHE
jgi:hypothetical protein